MRKRVVIVTPMIKPGGGPPGYVHNLMTGIRILEREGRLENIFIFLGRNSSGRNKATGNISRAAKFNLYDAVTTRLSKLGLKPLLSSRIRDAKKHIEIADLVIFQGFQEPYLMTYARKRGVRTVYMPHSPCPRADEYKGLCELNGVTFDARSYSKYLMDERYLIRNADVLAFPSEESTVGYQRLFQDQLNKKKPIYVRSGVSIQAVGEPSVRANGPPRLYFVGRYVLDRGYDLFCGAAAMLRDEGIEAQFHTLGDGPMKCSSPQIVDRGWRDDVHTVLRDDADIVVAPNRMAYYDLLPLECAALGKPLVMTAVGGNADQVRQLPDRIVCPEPSVSHLAAAMKKAIEKFRQHPRWGEANREAFARLFTAEAFARRWDEVISALDD